MIREHLRQVRSASLVGIVAASAAYTGMRRMCQEKDTVVEHIAALLEQQNPEPSKRFIGAFRACVTLVDTSHDLGHMLRDRMDDASFRDVMGQFRAVMKRKVSV